VIDSLKALRWYLIARHAVNIQASIRASVFLHPFRSVFGRESRPGALLAGSLFSAVVTSSVITSLSM